MGTFLSGLMKANKRKRNEKEDGRKRAKTGTLHELCRTPAFWRKSNYLFS